MAARNFPIVLTKNVDGWLVAECPIIPNCVTQGRTREAALSNAREAIELCLKNNPDQGWKFPDDYELVTVTVDSQ
jgi:predicted RNase H-like HicB family nuclease